MHSYTNQNQKPQRKRPTGYATFIKIGNGEHIPYKYVSRQVWLNENKIRLTETAFVCIYWKTMNQFRLYIHTVAVIMTRILVTVTPTRSSLVYCGSLYGMCRTTRALQNKSQNEEYWRCMSLMRPPCRSRKIQKKNFR